MIVIIHHHTAFLRGSSNYSGPIYPHDTNNIATAISIRSLILLYNTNTLLKLVAPTKTLYVVVIVCISIISILAFVFFIYLKFYRLQFPMFLADFFFFKLHRHFPLRYLLIFYILRIKIYNKFGYWKCIVNF